MRALPRPRMRGRAGWRMRHPVPIESQSGR
jgi:hypothetical protein